ncbi:MAG: flagellar assembly protein FliH [Pirellulaceae bacterium]|jgi:flagellar assembly protein FliH
MAEIIKAGKIREQGGVEAVAFSFSDMSQRAEQFIQQTQAKANGIITKAESDAQQIRINAMAEGKQDAVDQAIQASQIRVNQKLKTLAPAIQQAIDSINEIRQTWLKQWEGNMLKLAIQIAERVIRREVQHQPEIPQTLIREALEMATPQSQLRLYLNPQDYESLGNYIEELTTQFSQLAPLEVRASSDIQAGGCRLDTDHGTIDQQLDSQLQRVYEELTQ